jgi:hypothetical protein
MFVAIILIVLSRVQQINTAPERNQALCTYTHNGPTSYNFEMASKEERRLKILERRNFKEVVSALKQQGVHVKGFYHTSSWQRHWKGVIEEQLRWWACLSHLWPCLVMRVYVGL